MALTRVESRQRYTSFPRTPREREVFAQLAVDEHGVRVDLPSSTQQLVLRDAASVALLVDLLTSAHRRLVEIELAAAQMGSRDPGDAATPPVGAAPA
jgi:hypothetical protein